MKVAVIKTLDDFKVTYQKYRNSVITWIERKKERKSIPIKTMNVFSKV
jgi:hypothetical protein